MLYANTGSSGRAAVAADHHAAVTADHHAAIAADHHTAEALHGAVWIDLLNPTDAERAAAERATGLVVPARDDLLEIESSSRLSSRNGVLTLSMPLSVPDADGLSQSQAMGFVLSERYLITIRFADLPVFEQVARELDGPAAAPVVFVQLLETMVDRLADILEHLGAGLDELSRNVFRRDDKARNPARADEQLRAVLRQVGQTGDRLSSLRDSLLGVQRIVLYTTQRIAPLLPHDDQPRLETLRQDLASLTDYDTQLSNKVQFMLDATLGFINIEQNNSIKILTVVSVVGVPPTLVASIYGMNFKNMPELQWDYGYQYGLAMIVLTAVLPLLWFKRKGWI